LVERRFAGAVAPIAGAARKAGMGRAIAVRLAAEDAAIVVNGRRRDASELPEHERESGWTGLASVVEETADKTGASFG
jgi:NAD(P)-dependent dehydrogenase (short-subunit alcohol dehydrogenase family)